MTTVPSAEALRLAEAALDEIAPKGTVGEVVDAADEAGVLALRYRSQLAGYPDWLWTVTLAQVDGGEQSVLEVALLPGASSLVAPDWVPWTDRLADYLAAKEAAESGSDEDDDEDADGDDAPDDDGTDFDDFDEGDLGSSGDQDGVDVDGHEDEADGETAGR